MSKNNNSNTNTDIINASRLCKYLKDRKYNLEGRMMLNVNVEQFMKLNDCNMYICKKNLYLLQ